MYIAVDFDGTIVEHEYPEIGREIPFATETLKALQKDGHILILWTYRAGKYLDEAVEYCRKRGVEFYAINASDPGEVYNESMSRKINADLFIDDRNVGGLPDWGIIYQMISGNEVLPFDVKQAIERKNWILRLGERIERFREQVRMEKENR
jgi:hydroxymethylpyrimidine pyrophosphatase-like HAD family hydrolase